MPETLAERIADKWYVIVTTGDGARAWIMRESALHDELHKCYCGCDVGSWRECQTNGVIDMITAVDDPHNWSVEYPHDGLYMYVDRGEDYTLTITSFAQNPFQDFAREAVRQIRAEANSIEEAILILKVAAGGEG